MFYYLILTNKYGNRRNSKKKEIDEIKERNKRVEVDKAWETSLTRRLTVAISTYILIMIIMYMLEVEQPHLSAVIPTVGYLLSTLSVGLVKNWWLKNKR